MLYKTKDIINNWLISSSQNVYEKKCGLTTKIENGSKGIYQVTHLDYINQDS